MANTNIPVFLGINELSTGKFIVSPTPLLEMQKLRCACRGGCNSVDEYKHMPSGAGIQEMQWYFARSDFSITYDLSTKAIERLRVLRSGNSQPSTVLGAND